MGDKADLVDSLRAAKSDGESRVADLKRAQKQADDAQAQVNQKRKATTAAVAETREDPARQGELKKLVDAEQARLAAAQQVKAETSFRAARAQAAATAQAQAWKVRAWKARSAAGAPTAAPAPPPPAPAPTTTTEPCSCSRRPRSARVGGPQLPPPAACSASATPGAEHRRRPVSTVPVS